MLSANSPQLERLLEPELRRPVERRSSHGTVGTLPSWAEARQHALQRELVQASLLMRPDGQPARHAR
jgi:hypothetical protein